MYTYLNILKYIFRICIILVSLVLWVKCIYLHTYLSICLLFSRSFSPSFLSPSSVASNLKFGLTLFADTWCSRAHTFLYTYACAHVCVCVSYTYSLQRCNLESIIGQGYFSLVVHLLIKREWLLKSQIMFFCLQRQSKGKLERVRIQHVKRYSATLAPDYMTLLFSKP